MTSALIGYTGFVGSNIRDACEFDVLYNTSNIAQLAGQSFDLVVSAGNRADSHRINTHPQDDRAEVDALLDLIGQARIGKLVLVSTVCVYPAGGAPDETTPLSESGLTPYGINRLRQERVLQERFDTLVVRLPQLYGNRLKKGIVHDLLRGHRVEWIDARGSYQYYDVRRLWSHIQIALDAGISELNVATAPLRSDVVAREVFDVDIAGQIPPEP